MYRPNVKKHPLDWHEEAQREMPEDHKLFTAAVVGFIVSIPLWLALLWVFW